MNDIISISYEKSIKLLSFLSNQKFRDTFDFKRNHLNLYNSTDEKIIQFNFPLVINLSEDIIKDANLLNVYRSPPPDFAVMLIQTGNAALGFCKKGHLVHHKVIRKYMTRKKQGKSQLTYLKTKGKSRAGSRVRLANAVAFFEEINTKMSEWIKVAGPESIIYSCTPMLWGMLFSAKKKPPFHKKDIGLKKLPINTGVPKFEILQKVVVYSKQGYLQILAACPLELSKEIEKYIHSPGE